MYSFINGKIVENKEAFIHVSDLGFLRSYAVFDYLRTYNGKPFHLFDHLKRFRKSAAKLMLPLDYSDEEVSIIINKLLNKSKEKDIAIRFILTGGYSPDSMTPVQPNFLIISEKIQTASPETYSKGVKLITLNYQREAASAKTTNYVNAIKLKSKLKKEKAFDVLYCNKGKVLEVTRNNFFIFKNNVLITPSKNILFGITRKVVLKLARKHFETEIREVSTRELIYADEAFLCGSAKKIVPVIDINGKKIGTGIPGKNTKKLMQLFDEYTIRY